MIKSILKFSIVGVTVLFAMGCGSPEDFILSAEIVEVQFTGDVEDGDWFRLDDLKFEHVINDTTDLLNQPSLNHYNYFEDLSLDFINRGVLPAGKLFYHADGDRFTETVPVGRIAKNFTERLVQKQSNKKEGDLVYQVGRAQFLILGGKVYVKRNDDAAISVYSNATGRIFFNKLTKDDPTYSKLFNR